MARKKYVERYYALSEDDMQALIQKAKGGSGSAQLDLLEVFANFLTKYTTLLYYGKYNLSDYDIRRFVALFVKDPIVRGFLIRNKLDSKGARHVGETMARIQGMAQRYGDEEDVDQTVKMAFLDCVGRYERKGAVPFSGYLYSYYFFLLKKYVDNYLLDQLGRKTFPLLNEEDRESWEEEGYVGYEPPPTEAAEDLIFCEEIDEYWVAGDTASGPFANLSVQERQLLRWRYVDGERSSQIAARITEHPNTVREHFNRIRTRIRETVMQDLAEQ